MTRIAIVGDGHIRLPKNKDSVEYIEDVKRYEMLRKSLVNGNYQCVVFVGDLFDKARPSLEEIQFVTEFVKDLPNVILIDGNHEAVTKHTSTYDYVSIPNTSYMPLDRLLIEGVTIQTFGYKHLADYKYINKADILLSHFRCNLGFIKEEVPVAEIAKRFKDVILGDIHQTYNPLPNVHYTSSPYALHYKKTQDVHGYIELLIDKDEYKIKRVKLDLPTKYKVELSPSELIKLVSTDVVDRYIVEVEGTLEEIKSLPNHPLIKIVPKLRQLNVSTSTHGNERKDTLDTIVRALPAGLDCTIIENIYKEVV
jgi:hypothetical protein